MANGKPDADKTVGGPFCALYSYGVYQDAVWSLRQECQLLLDFSRIVAILLPALWLAGCARFVPSHRGDVDNYNLLLLADLPPNGRQILAGESVTGRGRFARDVVVSEDMPATPLSPARRYWRLSPSQCACRAARNAAVADLVDMEWELVAASDRASRATPDLAQMLQQTLLKLRATDRRNHAAGKALELYYRVVEVEAGRDAVRKSIRLVEGVLNDLTQLQGRGLSVDTDEFNLNQRRLELIERQQELVLQSDEINRQLKLLLRATGIVPPIWPDLKLKVNFEPIDADLAVATGVETRADLLILRLLAGTTDSAALATARSALQQREGSLGTQSPGIRDLIRVLGRQRGQREMNVRRRQLSRLLEAQHAAAVTEIRGASAEILARERQIRLSKAKLDKRRERLVELEQRRQAGGITAFDVFEERLEIIRVESELMKHVIGWKIAQVKWKRAQGLLAEECGYGRGLHAAETVIEPPAASCASSP